MPADWRVCGREYARVAHAGPVRVVHFDFLILMGDTRAECLELLPGVLTRMDLDAIAPREMWPARTQFWLERWKPLGCDKTTRRPLGRWDAIEALKLGRMIRTLRRAG